MFEFYFWDFFFVGMMGLFFGMRFFMGFLMGIFFGRGILMGMFFSGMRFFFLGCEVSGCSSGFDFVRIILGWEMEGKLDFDYSFWVFRF